MKKIPLFESALPVKSSNDSIPQYLPKGQWKVATSFRVGAGAWAIKFTAGTIVRSDGAGKIESYADNQWRLRKPPIQDTTKLSITSYGDHSTQRDNWNAFAKNMTPFDGEPENKDDGNAEGRNKGDIVYINKVGPAVKSMKATYHSKIKGVHDLHRIKYDGRRMLSRVNGRHIYSSPDMK